ncbi:importin subunit alpha-1b isoform X1 [Cryptomeria japonica]|uniref:importin subunit alpha-1b isoform X1 n=2 Tax=Cryptomeria japonica TaxID=3369 RepID=UPI0027DA9F6D|nr:importin subunit alpha-1b isoform X1 [Cryptomeria japonica]XP_057834501.2 importin subunit alpha-1b isoform X1 [Cryptomeria japonica]XP_057834502.2 importin subunit alpha-1b isoform X1 [Cryptomeria japonica]XP_057834505.2 importin subunit alpha-1b isoform X1 [Cryptomeria japonica]XP_057834506.2 importin subunit alpha-1b isoform X1 [Cryptomeria japonica]XP_057834507.2 importin subunit alpha-1b isoform X1 [Cryptomeria japonica]XP_057834508.2 importin subunit alpha-1b isoform X1 [Cryptomeria 
MADLRLEGGGKQISLSRNGGDLMEGEDEDSLEEGGYREKDEEEEDEANLDLNFYLIGNQESVTDEGSNDLRSAIYEVKCGDPKRQISALHQLRKIYSFQDCLINDEIGAVLINYLNRNKWPDLQYEAARMLRYMARDEPHLLVESDIVSLFSKLLNSPNEEVQEQGLRTVAIIADYAFQSRNYEIITEGLIFNLLPFFYRPKAPFHVFWFALKALVYIIHCKPEETLIALAPLKELLDTGEDLEVLKLACKAILYFSEENDVVESIVGNDICPCLVDLLFHDSLDILVCVMETMANIADYRNFKEVINERVLYRIVAILSSSNSRDSDTVRQLHIEICRFVFSITILTPNDIELTIKTGVISALVGLLAEAVDSVKEEATSAIISAIRGGSEEQVEYLVDLDCINLLVNLISPRKEVLTDCCKKGLERMMKLIKENSKYPHLFRIADFRLESYCSGFPPAKKPRFAFHHDEKPRTGQSIQFR